MAIIKVADIEEFYVCSLAGLRLGEKLLSFGEKVDLSPFSNFLRQSFYDRVFIGSHAKYLSISEKIRPSKSAYLTRKMSFEYIDIQENLNSSKAKINVSGRGVKK